MNLQEMKRRYAQEWILIEYEEADENFEVREGSVLAHSPNREEVYKALSQTFGKNVAVEFMGDVPADLTVMFFIA